MALSSTQTGYIESNDSTVIFSITSKLASSNMSMTALQAEMYITILK